ncbi:MULTISPECIES: hypothetical protein [unclassified Nocardioides]|uniref:hypothetical protein n=1 Tax=Nocardioides sp. URHA0032 TaxID=1380388 RepID=UPI000685F13E|nr:hypothetical protein [Nocardioides sp. URHA0032]
MTRLATRALDRLADPVALAHAQGVSTVIGGAWPLVSMRSFEAVFGPKEDRWLAYTVSGLLVTNGLSQVLAARGGVVPTARALGYGTAGTLLAIDLVFVPAGRIRWTYLIDAAFEAMWIGLWSRARRS